MPSWDERRRWQELVQEEFDVAGTGALRLTVARFYTPSGRAIQKPYGAGVDYEDDYMARFERGELFNEDSIAVVDSLEYWTPEGRVVHGGGGIVPDFFVPLDTAKWTAFLTDLSWTGILRDAAFGFVDANRQELEGLAGPGDLTVSMQDRAVTFLLEEAASAGWEARDIDRLNEAKLHTDSWRKSSEICLVKRHTAHIWQRMTRSFKRLLSCWNAFRN